MRIYNPRWRHQIETFSALLASGEFPTQRPVTRSFEVFLDLRLNKQLKKQWRRRWFLTPSRSLWCQCNHQSTHCRCRCLRPCIVLALNMTIQHCCAWTCEDTPNNLNSQRIRVFSQQVCEYLQWKFYSDLFFDRCKSNERHLYILFFKMEQDPLNKTKYEQ